MFHILKNSPSLRRYIQEITSEKLLSEWCYPENISELNKASAVLFLMGMMPSQNGGSPEPSLILNKRSDKVAQPGDLCCPGGGVSLGFDAFMAKAMTFPGLPMWQWPYWNRLRKDRNAEADVLRLLFFTSLRESYEEMRLNPFRVRFLGPLPTDHLVMFKRVIYPMVGWVSKQKRFITNWEVERIVYIPLRKLLDPHNYVRYQLEYQDPNNGQLQQRVYDSPSFLHQTSKEREVLWGATCRITLNFLKMIFDFNLPATETLPVLNGVMEERYVNPDRR